jgi:hypothetical protein
MDGPDGAEKRYNLSQGFNTLAEVEFHMFTIQLKAPGTIASIIRQN